MHLARNQLQQAFLFQTRSRLCAPISPYAVSFKSRKYTTHRDSLHSSLLSQSLDLKQQSTRRDDTVGPFRLGLTPSLQKEKVKKWSELSTGGKVMRTTARTSNLSVILLGAGLSVVLVYALTSELFSKNSATVLYGEACDKIKSSPQVAKYLYGPLSFHNNAPSSVRPRHRNRHVSSQIVLDSSGREHMFIHFYVSCKPGSTAPSSESSYLDSMIQWTQNKASVFSDLTLDKSIAWTKSLALDMLDRSKRLFKYLSGAPIPPYSIPSAPSWDPKVSQKEPAGAWSFAGLFSGLRGLKGGPTVESQKVAEGQVWTDGEVHADLIRNDEGYFVFRYLLVDIPNSRSRNHPLRVFVERSAGVRENESIMRWDS